MGESRDARGAFRATLDARLHALTPEEWVEVLWLAHFVVSWHHNVGSLPLGERGDMVDLLDPDTAYEMRHPADYVSPTPGGPS